MAPPAPILVTGATGYVGGRLVPRLLDGGRAVRCMARDPRRLDGRPWRDRVEVVAGDVLAPATLDAGERGGGREDRLPGRPRRSRHRPLAPPALASGDG